MKEKILNFISDNPYCKIGDLCSQYDGKKKDLMELLKTLEIEGDIIKEDDSFILPSTLGLLKATIVSVKKHCAFALIDNEAALKRFYRKNGTVILHPENPKYEDIIPEELVIQGIVKHVIHSY